MSLTQVTPDVISTNTISGLISQGFTSMNVATFGTQTIEFGTGNTLVFRANTAAERIRISNAGNVGIGTSSPSARLDVVAGTGAQFVATFKTGDSTSSNNAGGGFYCTSSATATSRDASLWLDADAGNFSGLDYFWLRKLGNSGNVLLNQVSNADMLFLTNNAERMRIDSSGNVGIGNTSPSALLHINGTNSGSANNVLTGSWVLVGSSLNSGLGIRQKSSDPGISGIAFPLQLAVRGGLPFEIYNIDSQPLVFGTAATERMRITSGGDVGIGTASPSTVLQVTKNQNATTRISVTNSDTTNTSSRAGFQATSGTVNLDVTAIQSLGGYVGTSSNHPLNLTTNGSDRLSITAAGQITVNLSGSESAPTITKTDDLNTGIFFPAADVVAITTGGVERIRYKADGFVYNPKKLIGTFDPLPGVSFAVPNYSYQVVSLSSVPNGQYYIAFYDGIYCRTSGMSLSTSTGITFIIGYCNDSVSDGVTTNSASLPAGFTTLAAQYMGWQPVDPTNGGFNVYNNGASYGYLLPDCTSFALPFAFNTANKKIVFAVKLNGSSGTILSNESGSNLWLYQMSAVSA